MFDYTYQRFYSVHVVRVKDMTDTTDKRFDSLYGTLHSTCMELYTKVGLHVITCRRQRL